MSEKKKTQTLRVFRSSPPLLTIAHFHIALHRRLLPLPISFLRTRVWNYQSQHHSLRPLLRSTPPCTPYQQPKINIFAFTHVPTCDIRVILQQRLFVLLGEAHEAFLPIDVRRHLSEHNPMRRVHVRTK